MWSAMSLTTNRGSDVGSAASKARLRLWLRVLKVSHIIERELRERLRVAFDTTLPRFDVMAALYRAEKWPDPYLAGRDQLWRLAERADPLQLKV